MDSKISLDRIYNHTEKLKGIFDFFDFNGDGTLSEAELRKGCDYVNMHLSKENPLDADILLEVLDLNKNGEISLNEFMETYRLNESRIVGP